MVATTYNFILVPVSINIILQYYKLAIGLFKYPNLKSCTNILYMQVMRIEFARLRYLQYFIDIFILF